MAVRKVTKTVEEWMATCPRCGKEYLLGKIAHDPNEPCRDCWPAEQVEKARSENSFLVGAVVTEFRISEDYKTDLESVRVRASDGRLFDVTVRRSYDDEDRGLDVDEVKP